MNWLEQRNIDFYWNSMESRLISEKLDLWIKISSKDQFDKISIVLKDNNLFDLSNTNFESISQNGEDFVIKKSNNWINIYWKNDNFISRVFRKYSNDFRLVWFISTWEQFQSLVWDEVYLQNDNNLADDLISRINQIRLETNLKLKKLKEQVFVDENYIVKKWDSLWKIVKEKYGLTDNRDIANAINSLVIYNKNIKKIKTDIAPPDGIRWDIIIEGKTIKIPHKLKVLGNDILRK